MSKETEAAGAAQNAVREAKPAEPESVYSAEELAKAAHMFDASPDIVRTALRVEGVTETTVSAAKRIVAKFKKREVQ